MPARISVIIPVFNDVDVLGVSLSSARAQTLDGIEILLVDGGSADGSGALCDRAAQEDARVRVLHLTRHPGDAHTRAAGLGAAAGDYVVWLDAGDVMAPDALQRLMRAVDAGASMAVGNYADGGAARYPKTAPGVISGREALHRLLRRELSQSLSFNLAPRAYYDGVSFSDDKPFADVRASHIVYARAQTVAMVTDAVLFEHRAREKRPAPGTEVAAAIAYCDAYLLREKVIETRWPECAAIFVRANHAPLLLRLRTAIACTPRCRFAENRVAIREISAYFRARESMALGDHPGRLRRAEYRLLTRGTRAGFILARALGATRRCGTYLENGAAD